MQEGKTNLKEIIEQGVKEGLISSDTPLLYPKKSERKKKRSRKAKSKRLKKK